VGFAQNAGLILGGSISQNNFLGTGNRVSLGLNRSEYQTRYNFGFVDPYWTEDGVSLGYNAFYRTTDYDELDYDVSSYSRNLRFHGEGRRQLPQLQGLGRLVRIDAEPRRTGYSRSFAE
uniref:BamA/TamA family outer membrane protein n=1 Tax=Salmonella enterica TaxID=28901 RepID=UPI000AE65A91